MSQTLESTKTAAANLLEGAVRAGVTPKTNVDNDIGQWNTFEITMKGDRLWVKLNGKQVLGNAQLPGIPSKGPIALQHHGGKDKEGNDIEGTLDYSADVGKVFATDEGHKVSYQMTQLKMTLESCSLKVLAHIQR